MQKNLFSAAMPHVIAIIAFFIISLVYFSPVLDGKKIRQSDMLTYQGASKEATDWEEEYGRPALWTNSMFGGMPTFLVTHTAKANLLIPVHPVLTLINLKPVNHIFLYLLGFYLLLLVFGINPWLSMAGAMAYAFSTYFIIILEPGHVTKAFALGYMPAIIGGVYLAFKNKPYLGTVMMTIFLTLQLFMNHLQITYYTMIIILFLGIFELYGHYVKKQIPSFLKTVALLFAGVILAVASNITSLWTTYEYGKYSIRGTSDLTLNNKDNQTGGLEKDYATSWSYGVGESMTLFIPNARGGSSSSKLDKNSETYSYFFKQSNHKVAEQYCKQIPTYWGPQPFTSGPVYLGASVLLLFIMGLFLLKGPIKWWLLSVAVLSLFLSWGKYLSTGNFFLFSSLILVFIVIIKYKNIKSIHSVFRYFLWGLTIVFVMTFLFLFLGNENKYDYCFNFLVLDYVPGYNKFRAVSMILVIVEFAVPLLAILFIDKLLKKEFDPVKVKKALIYSLSILGGIAFIFLLMGSSLFDFSSPEDARMKEAGYPVDAIISDRMSMLSSDSFRSLVFVLLAGTVVFLSMKNKIKTNVAIGLFAVIFLADLWPVNKRYVSNDNFISKREAKQNFVPTEADNFILQDKDPDFRVFNASVNTFNDASTSYYHKSIGGYSGVKMKRYQELIENQISKQNFSVLNMLNTKYFIIPTKEGAIPQQNPEALGNAWFVDSIMLVANADSELSALTKFNPAHMAIIDKRFGNEVKGFKTESDSGATIKLTKYEPEKLNYTSVSTKQRLAVFSEIYYDKGWEAYLDRNPVSHFRVNYVLRAMMIPAGRHEIEFRFVPRSYFIGEKISFASSIITIAILLLVLFGEWRKMNKAKAVAETEK